MKFVDKLRSTSNSGIYLITGEEKNKAAWYFVKIERFKQPIFEKEITEGKSGINLKQYGEIIVSGWGEKPPQDIINKYSD